MENGIFIGLQDFLKIFVAYQNPEDVFEYALAFKTNAHEIVLHVVPDGEKEVVSVVKTKEEKSAWHNRVFLTGSEWKQIEATGMHYSVNKDDSDLFDFFMSPERRKEIMDDGEWLKLQEESKSDPDETGNDETE